MFFKTEETHARSLAIDAQDNLIVGTEPSGLILRVSPTGQGFVLYQAPKREITAVAVTPRMAQSTPLASAIKLRRLPPPAPPPQPPPVAVTASARHPHAVSPQRAAPPPTFATGAPAISGGSEVYRINPDGSPRKVWSNAQDIVYAIGFDAGGLPLLGTGNRGKIYRLDSDTVSTLLLDASPTQVTGFGRGPQRRAVRRHRKYRQSVSHRTGLREERDRLKAKCWTPASFAYWGRISYRGLGKITVSTRSGNRSHPESNWSPWARAASRIPAPPACDSCGAGRTVSPSARFLQYKIELTPATGQPEPEVSYVEVAYLPKNVAPVVEDHRHHAAQLSLPRAGSLHHAVHLHHASAHRPAKEQLHLVLATAALRKP